MKFKKLDSAPHAVYIIRLEKGEEIIKALLEFCSGERISLGYFNGIGACSSAELGHFDVNTKKYSPKKVNGQFEIASLHGNITTMDSRPYIHAHISIADSQFNALGGHLKEGVVSATCEIILVSLCSMIERKKDDSTGLNLISL